MELLRQYQARPIPQRRNGRLSRRIGVVESHCGPWQFLKIIDFEGQIFTVKLLEIEFDWDKFSVLLIVTSRKHEYFKKRTL